jgi:hypothetical protein
MSKLKSNVNLPSVFFNAVTKFPSVALLVAKDSIWVYFSVVSVTNPMRTHTNINCYETKHISTYTSNTFSNAQLKPSINMDFTLTTDIEAELLDWDDDENGGDEDNHQSPGTSDLDYGSNERECTATDAIDEEDCILKDETASSINHTPSFESCPQEYFTASTFTEQSSMIRQRCSGTDVHDAANDNMRIEQNDALEPLYPPNFFFTGMAPWDPSQAVHNPNITKTATQDVALSNDIVQPSLSYNSNADSKMPARASPASEQQPSQQLLQWQPNQVSRRDDTRQIDGSFNNQHALNIAAAASAGAGSGFQRIAYDENSIQDTKRTITDSSTNTGISSSSQPSSFSSGDKKQRNVAKKSSSRDTRNQSQNNDQSDIPPFYLFDAPCELRTNFLQAQRQHAIATGINDSNSFHYGMAVNGFHPQENAQVNPIVATDSSGPAVLPNGKRVELLDGRHKNKRKAIERNEREQQRAQKISDLIEKLRDTMEQGGWKVEMKSKYQILST